MTTNLVVDHDTQVSYLTVLLMVLLTGGVTAAGHQTSRNRQQTPAPKPFTEQQAADPEPPRHCPRHIPTAQTTTAAAAASHAASTTPGREEPSNDSPHYSTPSLDRSTPATTATEPANSSTAPHSPHARNTPTSGNPTSPPCAPSATHSGRTSPHDNRTTPRTRSTAPLGRTHLRRRRPQPRQHRHPTVSARCLRHSQTGLRFDDKTRRSARRRKCHAPMRAVRRSAVCAHRCRRGRRWARLRRHSECGWRTVDTRGDRPVVTISDDSVRLRLRNACRDRQRAHRDECTCAGNGRCNS